MALPCTIATGGYGRGDMAPFSDIDLVILTETAPAAATKKMIERLNAACWERGLKPSFSLRALDHINDDMARDLHFMTSLLDRRFLFGQRAVYKKLDRLMENERRAQSPGHFVAAKLAERDARHIKNGDSRFVLQPNVKESKGGLRDIQTLFWITHYLYGVRDARGMVRKSILTRSEAATLQQAHAFFTRVRHHQHETAGRAEDRLSFDIQPDIALKMGYTDCEPHVRAEKFMKDYFIMAGETGYLTRILCAELESRALDGGATAGSRKIVIQDVIDGFPIHHNRVNVPDTKHFRKHPEDMLRIFRVSQHAGLDIHPDALRLIRRDKTGAARGIKILTDIILDRRHCTKTLRRLNEAGMLTALIPDFANIFAHMQYDMYHVYTADEHTINAISILHKIATDKAASDAPLATALMPQIHSRRALFIAMLFHDMAKGTGGDHARKGAQLVHKHAPRMGLTSEETETAAWLVEEHLLMTMTAFKKDLNDPKTVADFAAAVQSPERLKLLTVMTTADIMAVGPDRWNNFKSGLLSDLYARTHAELSGSAVQTDSGAEKIAGSMDADSVSIIPRPDMDYTEVVIHTPDRKGLFSILSGAMAAAGASIMDARIHTLDNGMALDTFYIQNMSGKCYDNAAFLKKTLRAALDGKTDLKADIAARRKAAPRRGRMFSVETRIIIDNDASNTATMVEVNARDRIGLLHDITSALAAENVQISAAKVTTFGARAVDVFYVRDSFGFKIMHEKKIAAIESALRKVIDNV
jgi:[protein-PII] uridylyltransferase